MLENQEIFNSAILWNNGDLDASAFHEVVIKGDLKKYVQVLAERLHLNLEQALFIPFFVKNLDEAQDYRDISRYFNCIETYRIIEHSETLESLAALGYINIETNYRNEICFRMPASVVQCIVQGKQPEPISNGAGKDKKEKVDKNELLSNLEIVNNVVELTKEKGLPDIDNNEPLKQHLLELGKRFCLNNEEALFLSLFIHMCDDSNIRYFDFARYFSVKTPQVMQYVNTISSLINLGYVTRSSDCRVNSFRIPENVVRDFTLGIRPQWSALCKTSQDWIVRLNRMMERVRWEDLSNDELKDMLEESFAQYHQFEIVQKLQSFKLNICDLKIYIIMILKAVMEDKFEVGKSDIRSYYRDGEIFGIVRNISKEKCKLFTLGLIDYVNEDGRCHHDKWCLTEKSKTEVLHEFLYDQEFSRDKLLKPCDKIQEKPLFYCDSVARQVEQLRQLLSPEKMNAVLERMAEKGMRKGFACLFYGGPGTGKTETVLQLARQTGRDIMQVEIASIRDKWVGETEKNIKQIFDKYRNLVKNCKVTPILLFNEADALFNTRNEDSKHSVDKMENAMQNIILQEMEDLEGIMIATTNLTKCLDSAFERRFLFKIEFTKPTPAERCHIWHAMIPELSEADAMHLSEEYDFSGGQIENITRKAMIGSILWGKEKLGLDALWEMCRHEQINPQYEHAASVQESIG